MKREATRAQTMAHVSFLVCEAAWHGVSISITGEDCSSRILAAVFVGKIVVDPAVMIGFKTGDRAAALS